MPERGFRKTRFGTVVSNSMDKTIVVSFLRKTQHPIYGKIVKTNSKLYLHDEENPG